MDYLHDPACTPCRTSALSNNRRSRQWSSPLLSFLVLVLPKCPFCVVAYSSSMAICGAPSVVDQHTGWGTWLALGLALICIGSIARNYRGKGTHTAIVIALIGLSFLFAGLFSPDALIWYYVGAALLFLGSFYNGRGYRWLRTLVQ